LLMFELGDIAHVYVSKYAYYLENMTGPVYNHFNRYDLGGRYNSLQSPSLINVLRFLQRERLVTTISRARPGKSPIKLWKLTDSGVLYVKGSIVSKLDADEYRRFGNLIREIKKVPKNEFVEITEAHYRHRIDDSARMGRLSLDPFLAGSTFERQTQNTNPISTGTQTKKKWLGIHRKPVGIALIVSGAVGVTMLIVGTFLSISIQQAFAIDFPSTLATFVGMLAYLRR